MMLPTPLISKDMKGTPDSPNCPPFMGFFALFPPKSFDNSVKHEKGKKIFNSSARRIKGRLTSHPPEAEAQNQGLKACCSSGSSSSVSSSDSSSSPGQM